MAEKKLVLDACCLINLDASGMLIEIIESLPFSAVVSSIVWEEEITVIEQIRGEAGKAIETQLIDVVEMQDDELEAFIEYAAYMGDDGESASFAIAINRNWAVATDDKGALNFLTSLNTGIKVCSTLELMQIWAEARGKSAAEIRQALLQVKEKGRYMPGKGHPLYGWWEQYFKG